MEPEHLSPPADPGTPTVRMDLTWLRKWTPAARTRMTAIGLEEWVGAIEPWVTEGMATAPRKMRRWLIWFLAKQAGVSPHGLRLVSGHDPRWRCGQERRCPDLLLVDAAGNIRVVVEIKARAAINGSWGYCRPLAPAGYSDQLICYGHGCWTDRDLSEARFLLVVPLARLPHLRADQQWAVDRYDGVVGSDPWQVADLELLYQGLIAVAKRPGPCQSHAAVLVRLVAAWWWRLIPVDVPLVIA